MTEQVCALANAPEGGLLPSLLRPALDGLVPIPILRRTRAGLLVEPTETPCAYRGRVFVLDKDGPRAANPDEILRLRDDCGEIPSGDLAAAPGSTYPIVDLLLADRPSREGARAFEHIHSERFAVRSGEAALHGIAPVHVAAFRAPMLDAVDALVNELVAGLPGGRSLERCVREVLVNAVGHRSYAPWWLDVPIVVRRYPNELVVRSPGRLPRRSRLREGRVTAQWSRNPELMARLTAGQAAHQQGRGLVLARQGAIGAGYTIHLEDGLEAFTVRVVLDPARAFAAPGAIRRRSDPASREDRILACLAQGDGWSAEDLSTDLGLPSPTVRADLRRLIAAGTVEATHAAIRSPKQAYRLSPAEAGRRQSLLKGS